MASIASPPQSHENNDSMSEVLSSIDLLTLIAQRLENPHDLFDLVYFAQVCKTWHQAADIVQRQRQQGASAIMPWKFSCDISAGRFGLRDFWSPKQNCSLELKIFPELKNLIMRGLQIFISKHGWLLLRKPLRYSINLLTRSKQTKVEFAFCNPILNKMIELPCLYLGEKEVVDKCMIISTHPALAGRNTDRVVAIISSRGGDNYRVVTCNPRARNKEWTSHTITIEGNPDPKKWCSAYMDGTLYFSFGYKYGGKIGMLGIANEDSGVAATREQYSSLELEWCYFFELFESNGQLLLATRYMNACIGMCWGVYQFDPRRKDSRNQWTSIKSLGNRALAISTCPSGDRVVVIHEAKEFADMIIDGKTTYTRQIDERGSIWRKDHERNFMRDDKHEWNFRRASVTNGYFDPLTSFIRNNGHMDQAEIYIEPIRFA